jgi:hypothetical protein
LVRRPRTVSGVASGASTAASVVVVVSAVRLLMVFVLRVVQGFG